MLSLGKRIVEEGYSFEWHHGRKPVLTAPDGTRTVCKVRNLCPHVDERGSCLVAAPASSSSFSSRPVVVEASSVVNPMNLDVEIQNIEFETDDEEEPRGRDLVAEAKSLEHQLTHRWKNPHCQFCQAAKMQTARAPNRKKERKEEAGQKLRSLATT